MKAFSRILLLNLAVLVTGALFFAAKQTEFLPGHATITIKLHKGSQLFITYPINTVQMKELTLDKRLQDTLITITVNTTSPFTIINMNKTYTPYLFFPGYHYTTTVSQGEANLHFECDDKRKAWESNALYELETVTSKFSVSNDTAFLKLIGNKKYSRTLDNYFLDAKNKRLERIATYQRENKISPEGVRFLTAYVNYDFISKRLIPFYYQGFDYKQLPEWYNDSMRLCQQDFDDTTCLQLFSFKGAIIYNNRFLGFDAGSGVSLLSKQFAAARHFTTSPQINNLLLYQVLNHQANKADKQYPAYIDSFKLWCSDTLYKSIITGNYEYAQKEAVGANIAQLTTVQRKALNLDSFIRRQKKLIYLDCWASWCAPCKSEMPFSDKLQQDFKGKDISFVFLSLDSAPSQWATVMSDYAFMNSDNSFLLTGNFQSAFVKKHRIGSIPRYILMSNEGTIIDDDAPRPGDPALRELLAKAMKQ